MSTVTAPTPATPIAIAAPAPPPPAEVGSALRPFTAEEYLRMAREGYFEGQRVELIQGQIVVMSPQGNAHTAVVFRAQQRLNHVFDSVGCVVSQYTFRTPLGDLPDPDIAALPGEPADWVKSDTLTPLLVGEVSVTTLRYDRTTKASIYAGAGITDYWIFNVEAREIEIRRDPHDYGEDGWRYRKVDTFGLEDTVTTLRFPDHPIPVRDLMI